MRKIFFIVILLVFCSVSVVSANENITPSGIPYSELKNRIDDTVAKYIGTSIAGANVLIVKDGEIFLNESYGYANIENQTKVTPNTVFEWGSITKLLVWTSVMQLVEQGKLDLNEDIRTYLPDGFLTKLQFDTPITMLHLMHHSAGWEERYVDLFFTSADDIKPLEETLRMTEPYQVHEPGSVVSYSNYGVALAGFIVERITEQPFYEYVNEHIFSVLNMNDTSIHPTQQDNENIATKRDEIFGYFVNDGELSVSKNERIFIGLYPAGSGIGTIEDLSKFMIALMPDEGKDSPLFQKRKTLETMFSTSDFYDDGFPRNAHGFWESLYAENVLGHPGSTDSFSSNFIFSKDNQLGLIIMANSRNASGLINSLSTLLFGEVSIENNEAMENLNKFEGSFHWTRQPYKGFTKLYGALNTTNVEVTESNKINVFGTTYEQVAPLLYKSTEDSNDYFHVTVNDGEVEKISLQITDLVPVSKNMKIFKTLSFIAVVFTVLYSFITLLILFFRYRKKEVQSARLRKWETLLLLSNAIPLVNTIILGYRTINYTPYAALKVHFWINFAYIFIVALCIIVLLFGWKKEKTTHGQKIRHVLSCVSALLLVVLIFGWKLYY